MATVSSPVLPHLLAPRTEVVTGDQSKRAAPVKLRPPARWGESDARLLDLVFAVDESGSMFGTYGDPRCVRRAAALSVTNLLARAPGSRVGVVHWGSHAPASLALALTDSRRRHIIGPALAIPPSLGGNNLPAALARAREVLGCPDLSRNPLVVVITDGIEDVGAGAANEIALLAPASVHVLLVDHSHGCDAELEAKWRLLALGSFNRLNISTVDTASLQAARVISAAAHTSSPTIATTRTTTNFRR